MARTGLIYSIGKTIAPTLSRLLQNGRVSQTVDMLEEYAAVLQGRGAGTGWDLKSEVIAALPFVTDDESVIFDVGANVGEWSEMLLEHSNVSPQLYLFEPLTACQDIIKSLELPNATLVAAAVGSKPGTVTLYHPSSDTSTLASVYKRRDSALDEREMIGEEVDVVSIDSYAKAHQIEQIDFLKIDVEGHELSVLSGARQMLKEGKISALLFEFGSPHINSRTFFIDFWDLLCPYGYHISRICPGNVLRLIERYHEGLEYFRNTSNYLAIHAEMMA